MLNPRTNLYFEHQVLLICPFTAAIRGPEDSYHDIVYILPAWVSNQ